MKYPVTATKSKKANVLVSRDVALLSDSREYALLSEADLGAVNLTDCFY